MRLRVAIAAVIVGTLFVATYPSNMLAQSQSVVMTSEAMKWRDNRNTLDEELDGMLLTVPGARQAILWGDPAKGAHGALRQVPSGTVLPMHTHKNEMRVLTVKGTMTYESGGQTTTLGPGSYVLIPGGVAHATACKGASLCEYLEQMSNAYDWTPVTKG